MSKQKLAAMSGIAIANVRGFACLQSTRLWSAAFLPSSSGSSAQREESSSQSKVPSMHRSPNR